MYAGRCSSARLLTVTEAAQSTVKKLVPYLFALSVLVLVVAGMSLVIFTLPSPDARRRNLAVDMATADAMAHEVINAKCAACHSAEPDYNSFVNFFTGGLIRRDINNARRAWKIEGDPEVRSGLVDLLKIDHVLRTRRMPPARYTVVHLGTRLTPDDVCVLRMRYGRPMVEAQRFAPLEPVELQSESEQTRAYLGYLLYHDARLSTTNTVSCSTCHAMEKGGTDNKPKSEGVPGADGKPQLGGVNAPTVFNAAGHIRQFWDGRAATLKEQAGGPPLNPVEMGYAVPEDWERIAAKLREDERLVALFEKVYGPDSISGETITDAIAAFEQTLTTPDSAFDLFLKGDHDALDDEQKEGMRAFVNYGCATCHAGPALGGLSFEPINKRADFRSHTPGYQEGAYGLQDHTKRDEHRDLFRVPTLRNVALTHPYFHTGAVATLPEAVRIMFHTQAGTVPSAAVLRKVTRFLEAQTGTFRGKPLPELTPQDVAPAVATEPERP